MELLVFMGFFALLAGGFTLWAYIDYTKNAGRSQVPACIFFKNCVIARSAATWQSVLPAPLQRTRIATPVKRTGSQ